MFLAAAPAAMQRRRGWPGCHRHRLAVASSSILLLLLLLLLLVASTNAIAEVAGKVAPTGAGNGATTNLEGVDGESLEGRGLKKKNRKGKERGKLRRRQDNKSDRAALRKKERRKAVRAHEQVADDGQCLRIFVGCSAVNTDGERTDDCDSIPLCDMGENGDGECVAYATLHVKVVVPKSGGDNAAAMEYVELEGNLESTVVRSGDSSGDADVIANGKRYFDSQRLEPGGGRNNNNVVGANIPFEVDLRKPLAEFTAYTTIRGSTDLGVQCQAAKIVSFQAGTTPVPAGEGGDEGKGKGDQTDPPPSGGGSKGKDKDKGNDKGGTGKGDDRVEPSPSSAPPTPAPTTSNPTVASTPPPRTPARTKAPTERPPPSPPTTTAPTPTADASSTTACVIDVSVECVPPRGMEGCDSIRPAVTRCEGTPVRACMRYAGGGCTQTTTPQLGTDSYYCMDFNGGPPAGEGDASFVVVTARKDPTTVYHADWVAVGDVYCLSDDDEEGGAFRNNLNIDVYDADYQTFPSDLLQAVTYNSGCFSEKPSMAVSLGDRFGASQLVEWENADQGVVTSFLKVRMDHSITIPLSIPGRKLTTTSFVSYTSWGVYNSTDDVYGFVTRPGDGIEASFTYTFDATKWRSYEILTEIAGVTNLGVECRGVGSYTFSVDDWN